MMMQGVFAIAVLVAAAASGHAVPVTKAQLTFGLHPLHPRDLERAALARPSAVSHVHGTTAKEAFAKMNLYLDLLSVETAPCADLGLESLNDVARTLFGMRQPGLDVSYRLRDDRRALHFDDLEYKEALWKTESEIARIASVDEIESIRGGKCAEIVMWFIHHLSQSQRDALAMVDSFVLPLMPVDVSDEKDRAPEYDQQIGCTSCHLPVHVPGTPPVTPIPHKKNSGPQYPVQCPIDSKTNLPTVWYNRTKRCDWDYSPACQPCEGIGGMMWGNQEHEWKPMACQPLGTPSDVPVEKRAKPLWPKSFTVQEYAALTFPGKDPCNVKFKNSTYTLNFRTTAEGPTYHTVGHTGPSGPSPFPGKSWATPQGNFWNTVDVAGRSIYCICLGNMDPVVKNAFTGPLRYDFASDAKYIGRERIIPEYLNKWFVTDHYAKGPHHFWYDVETGNMIRAWQPFNGLQTYYDWDLSTPSDAVMDIPKICTKGLLHANITCKV